MTAKAPTTLQNLGYSFDLGGNIQTITDTINGTQTFLYDELNRLTSATGPYGSGGASATLTYGFDQIGNLTNNSQVGVYTYPTSGSSSVQPHAVSTAGASSYVYDANGNLTSGAGRTLTYDAENRPLTITSGGTTTTFVYDGDGGRVKKIVGTLTSLYIGKLYECENTACTKLIFAGSQRIAMKQVINGVVDYYHPDHLGSTSVVTTATGTLEQSLAYYPFGGTWVNTGTANVPYKYTGKELDASTGLYFYEARYYDPALGRFISADTIVPSPRDPQSLNRYSYVGNNPLRYTDPTGHWKCCKIKKFLNRALGDLGTTALGIALQGSLGAAIFGPANFLIGGAVLAHSDSGRRVLGAEVGVAGWVVCGPACSGAASGAVSAALAQTNGERANILRSTAAGAAAAEVASGLSQICTVLCGGAAGGAVSAAILGGDPGTGALRGLVTAAPIFAYQVYNIAYNIYSLVNDPANWQPDNFRDTVANENQCLRGSCSGVIAGANQYQNFIDFEIQNNTTSSLTFRVTPGLMQNGYGGAPTYLDNLSLQMTVAPGQTAHLPSTFGYSQAGEGYFFVQWGSNELRVPGFTSVRQDNYRP